MVLHRCRFCTVLAPINFRISDHTFRYRNSSSWVWSNWSSMAHSGKDFGRTTTETPTPYRPRPTCHRAFTWESCGLRTDVAATSSARSNTIVLVRIIVTRDLKDRPSSCHPSRYTLHTCQLDQMDINLQLMCRISKAMSPANVQIILSPRFTNQAQIFRI